MFLLLRGGSSSISFSSLIVNCTARRRINSLARKQQESRTFFKPLIATNSSIRKMHNTAVTVNGPASVFPTPQLGVCQIPDISNEPMKSFAPGSAERTLLSAALSEARKSAPFKVPIVVNGEKVFAGNEAKQVISCDHKVTLCDYHEADAATVKKAIEGALSAKRAWEAMPFNDRAAIFLKAADLLSSKYRYKMMAYTMLGQGKTTWQAEIDCIAELTDFWRFNVKYAADIYAEQPKKHSQYTWNRLEYRALDGFVAAISPFNFTAIGGNLPSAPALMGNVVVWKPAPSATLSNYLIYEILEEAGLPPGVIQFIPGPAAEVVAQLIEHPECSAIHFTGSTAVFKHLWKQVANNLDRYVSYPRLVGETGGKNMHFVHSSAQVKNVVNQTIRSAFEYQGQKCSACSRAYFPDNLWPEIKKGLLEQVPKIKVGPVDEYSSFMSSVINEFAFKKIKGFIDYVKQDGSKEAKILVGGTYDDSTGYYIHPTIIETTNPQFKTMTDEIFGPVLTVYVYPANEYEKYLDIASKTSPYALTGALFAQDRSAIITGSNYLRPAAGNFYINDKSTGAVVGQQPFGGSRASGTNDKAGAALNLYRWVSARSIKESFVPLEDWNYPSNQQ